MSCSGGIVQEEMLQMIKEKKRQEELTFVSSQISKRLKSSFGKGPDSCFSTLEEKVLFVHIRKFRTPSEEVLLQRNEIGLALTFRNTIMTAIFENIKQELIDTFDLDFNSFFQDWNFETNTGLLMFHAERVSLFSEDKRDTNDFLTNRIHIAYSETCKVPTKVEIYNLNNIFIAGNYGVLSALEVELFQKGHFEILRAHSYSVKHHLQARKHLFIPAFRQELVDMYIYWDYKRNKNYMIFYLK